MITLTEEPKNSESLVLENRVSSPTWDEATMTWDEADETWENTSLPVFEMESKNTITLNLETK